MVTRLTALGHEPRLAIFRLLMRRYPDRVPAGEIADVLDFRASTLSSYLAALLQAGLVTQLRTGTSLLYRVNMEEVRKTFDYLLRDCCRGRPELCLPDVSVAAEPATVPGAVRPLNVLFVCSGNSARSIVAESILRQQAGERFAAWSAGTTPRSALNPFALEELAANGHDIAPLRAKHVSEFQGSQGPRLDFVFTVCDRAANEFCPNWDSLPLSGHWGMPDPARATGSDASRRLAFRKTYDILRSRIDAFTALPLETLDRLSLQLAVDAIATDRTGMSA